MSAEALVATCVIVFIGFPLTIGVVRLMWRRASVSHPRTSVDEHANRLAQMQQSIDSIAIEVERISEGQRFLTKVLNEQRLSASVIDK